MNNIKKLSANRLIKNYGKKGIVRGVNLELNRGEIVGLLGPNGAGKTTTFYMINGMIRPTSGKIFLDDMDITKLPMYKRARHGIGYLAQEPSVFTKLSVEQNLQLVLEMTELNKDDQKLKLEKLLKDFSIEHLRKSKAMTLSGGERRRTEIARPFAGVDPIAVEDIQKIIKQLKKSGIGVLITDHNVRETLTITDRAYLLYEGAILKSGTVKELTIDKEVKRLYLGNKFKMDFN